VTAKDKFRRGFSSKIFFCYQSSYDFFPQKDVSILCQIVVKHFDLALRLKFNNITMWI